MLIFENENGSSEFFFQEDLEKMIKVVAQQVLRMKSMKATPDNAREAAKREE